jgi:hypothetical protein
MASAPRRALVGLAKKKHDSGKTPCELSQMWRSPPWSTMESSKSTSFGFRIQSALLGDWRLLFGVDASENLEFRVYHVTGVWRWALMP